MHRAGFVLLTLATLASCDSSPADVAGDYTLAITNHDNGCSFQNWTVGESSSNVPLTITQNGHDVTAILEGVTGVWVEAGLGSKTFTGDVTGNALEVTLYGTRSGTQGGCAYTVNATAYATLAGDTLTGTIEYTPATNGSPDCGALEGCVSEQAFNGTRPPP
jgi:hypothetical protein